VAVNSFRIGDGVELEQAEISPWPRTNCYERVFAQCSRLKLRETSSECMLVRDGWSGLSVAVV
jgi:endonuclease YncB( thermonuclease family)